ncbi:DMT family transporter [Microvirga flavescens]|uniref:DMT family transporter n=1 Tax=Microvirga flavescens TaxID=2249811 RepID=UPI001FE0E0E2|nr:DMT family transporter [Microvirga flavescens]
MTSTVRSTMNARDWAMLIILSIVWGGSFFFVGIAVKELPPFTIVALRVSIAALALLGVLRIMGLPFPRERRVWAAFLGMGILNNLIPFLLIVWGQRHIASGLASILNATTPLFTVIVAHFLTSDERLSGRRLAGVIVGFIGVAVMIGGTALQALNADVLAQLAILGAAISYAFAGVFGRRFKVMGVPPFVTAAGQLTGSSLLLVPIALLVDQPWTLPAPHLGTVFAILGLALVSSAFAYILYFRLLASAGATNTGLVTFLIPVSAILFGVLFLGEVLQPKHYIGMALIGAGLLVMDGRVLKALARLSGARPLPGGNG